MVFIFYLMSWQVRDGDLTTSHALKSLNFSISKRLLHLRFLANSLNLTILSSSEISHWAVSLSVFFFFILCLLASVRMQCCQIRETTQWKYFYLSAHVRVGEKANCIWAILGNVLNKNHRLRSFFYDIDF